MAQEIPVTEVFPEDFMLTRNSADPRGIDYKQLTHTEENMNPDGTPRKIMSYMNYDPGTDTFSDLAVEEDYTYTYDGPTLILTQIDIIWYTVSGSGGTTFTKYIAHR